MLVVVIMLFLLFGFMLETTIAFVEQIYAFIATIGN